MKIAIPGLVLFAEAARVLLFGQPRRRTLWLALAGLGCTLAAGCKENFVFLALPFGALAALEIRRARSGFRLAPAAITAAGLAVPALVAWAIAAVAGQPVDFYGRDNALFTRLAGLQTDALPLAVILACQIAAAALARPGRTRDPRPRAFLAVITTISLYALWEALFYNGRLPSAMRYDFPSGLFPALDAGLVFALAEARHGLTRRVGQARFRRVAALALIACLPHIALRNLHDPSAMQRKRAHSQALHRDLDASAALLRADPGAPVIVLSRRILDYETLDNMKAWMILLGLPNPLHLAFVPDTVAPGPDQTLAARLTDWSQHGRDGVYRPLAEAMTPGPCFLSAAEAGLSQPEFARCRVLPFQPERYY